MRIPARLQDKLSHYPELHAGVLASIAQVEPWVASSTLPFFPEYTDHGITHLEAVLATAEALIRDEAWPSLTPADAAALVLAVLLHDVTMHLTEDGFIQLISAEDVSPPVDGFNDKAWPSLWVDFLSEARRWDGRKLMDMFGDSRPVRVPPLHSSDMTRRDRQLIGEFLRRHHHRHAHEIAVNGVPGPTTDRIRLREVPDWLADLSGLIARSHGMPLRQSLPPLERNFGLREFKGVRAPFLMVVLRVADYLQVQSERAPAQVLQVAKIQSPISQREWQAHHAILDIQNTHADPEAIFLMARPPTVEAFLKVQRWQIGIQEELDVGWAVIGEVYGRYHGLSNLGLVIRRVRSSLDDLEGFAEQIEYIPRRAAFEAAGADLLKLLIAPLYGNRPTVGARELMQNALDAVLERRALHGGEEVDSARRADVTMTVIRDANNDAWLEVRDHGIGMTDEVIVDYFLRAGASYRHSREWHEQFEDQEGHSLVRRSGRFGVGALAAFLLGPEISVVTRHVDAAYGIEFTATVDTSAIQMNRVDAPVGTTIRVKLSAAATDVLVGSKKQGYTNDSWAWYCLSDPVVERRIGRRTLNQHFSLPTAGEPLNYPWRRVEHPDFEDVQWTYTRAPHLVCNGIVVMRDPVPGPRRSLWSAPESTYTLLVPRVSVFDRDGVLPLNLQRDNLSENAYPFYEQLLEGVATDILAWLTVFGPNNTVLKAGMMLEYLNLKHPAVGLPSNRWNSEPTIPTFSTESGWAVADPWNVSHIGSRSTLILPVVYGNDWVPDLPLPREYAAAVHAIPGGEIAFRSWFRLMAGQPDRYWFYGHNEFPLKSLDVEGRRILLRVVDADAISQPRKLSGTLRASIAEDWRENGWVLWRVGECPASNVDFRAVASTPPNNTPIWDAAQTLTEWYPKTKAPATPSSPLAREWFSIVGSPFLDYDPARREASIASDPLVVTLVQQYRERMEQLARDKELKLSEM
jgi:molecular chaperone HtpG